MIEDGTPAREIELPLHDPGQPVVGRPCVEKVAVLGHPLAPGCQEPRRQTGLAEDQMHGMQLVPAVAAVLLALAGHAVHQGLLAQLWSVLIEASKSRCSAGSEERMRGSCGQEN